MFYNILLCFAFNSMVFDMHPFFFLHQYYLSLVKRNKKDLEGQSLPPLNKAELQP